MNRLAVRIFFAFLAAQFLFLGILLAFFLHGYERSILAWQEERNALAIAYARSVLQSGIVESIAPPVNEAVFIFNRDKELVYSNRGGGRRRLQEPGALTPLYRADELIGYVSLPGDHFTDDAANNAFLSSMQRVLLLAFGCTFVVSFALALLLAHSLARPARLLAARLDQMAGGDLSSPVAERGPAEIVSIARSARRLGQELLAEKGARARFSADMAHDLRTPLSALRAQLEGMRDGVLDASPERFTRNLRELERLEELTESLAELMRLEQSGYTVVQEKIDAADFFHELGEAFEIGLLNKRITFQIEVEASSIVGDRSLLRRALGNLLSNAVRHAEEGGIVRISSRQDKSRTVLAVRNSGPAVPAADLPHVFDRLYRGEYARGTPGSGLGLTIAKQIAELHGGEIHMTSEDGKGTEVRISLPDAPPH